MSAPKKGTGPEKCVGCGMVATGYARINDDRYCHGDDDSTPTCYERASRNAFHPWNCGCKLCAGRYTQAYTA